MYVQYIVEATYIKIFYFEQVEFLLKETKKYWPICMFYILYITASKHMFVHCPYLDTNTMIRVNISKSLNLYYSCLHIV